MPFAPEVLVALAKAAPKLADKDALPVGAYPIDAIITLHVLGELQKLEDTEYTPTTSIPLLDSVALFISRMGPVRRGEVMALWESCVRDALLGQGEVEDGIRGDIEAMHDKIRDSLDAMPKKVRAGEVRGKVTATILERPAIDDLPIIIGGYTPKPKPGAVANANLKPPRGDSAVQSKDAANSRRRKTVAR